MLTLLIVNGFVALSHAQPPYSVSSQAPSTAQISTTRLVRFAGVLTDVAGNPLVEPQTVTFSLFEQAEGGTALWTETLTVTPDDHGRYTVGLGSMTPLPQAMFTREQARWIGTAIDGHDLGRTALVAVPYALKAADADTLGGHPASNYVRTRQDGQLETSAGLVSGPTVDGTGVPGQIAKWAGGTTLTNSVISESSSNRVGFGLVDPTGGGVVDSVFTIKNYDNNTGFGILNETQQRRFAINTLADGGWLLYDGGNSTWNAGLYQRAGNVGLGTTTPLGRLGIFSGSNYGLYVQSTNADAVIGNTYDYYGSGNGVSGWSFSGRGVYAFSHSGIALSASSPYGVAAYFASGNVGIGTSIPADKLDVAADIRVGNGTTGCVKDADGTVIAGTCASDARFKKNITPFSNALNELTQLQPVRFDWRADEFPDRHFGAVRSFGLVAQDVEAVLPELVVTDSEGFKGVKYSELPLYLVQAVKELKAQNDALRSANTTLEHELQAQNERLQRLEALVGK